MRQTTARNLPNASCRVNTVGTERDESPAWPAAPVLLPVSPCCAGKRHTPSGAAATGPVRRGPSPPSCAQQFSQQCWPSSAACVPPSSVHLERSAQFYEEYLGLRRSPAGPPHAVVFDTRPVAFAVREPLAGFDPASVAQPGEGASLWLQRPTPNRSLTPLTLPEPPLLSPRSTDRLGGHSLSPIPTATGSPCTTVHEQPPSATGRALKRRKRKPPQDLRERSAKTCRICESVRGSGETRRPVFP